MLTYHVLALLQKKFGPPEHCFLSEVRNSTGHARTPRTADALAFSLWPSRGLELHGFEIKVSRGDWLRELKNPAKADAIATYCDRWWIVAGDDKVVVSPEEELPKTWGLLVASDKGLKTVKAAPLNDIPASIKSTIHASAKPLSSFGISGTPSTVSVQLGTRTRGCGR